MQIDRTNRSPSSALASIAEDLYYLAMHPRLQHDEEMIRLLKALRKAVREVRRRMHDSARRELQAIIELNPNLRGIFNAEQFRD